MSQSVLMLKICKFLSVGKSRPCKVSVVYTSLSNMTHTTALGMLKVGNTGNEILQILDVIVADIVEENNIALQKLKDACSAAQ